jgi:hypothetical protein
LLLQAVVVVGLNEVVAVVAVVLFHQLQLYYPLSVMWLLLGQAVRVQRQV